MQYLYSSELPSYLMITMVNNLRCILSLHFKLVIQVVCTRGSNTFTAGMAMEYSHMQEMSDLYQAKDRKLINYYRL